MASLTTRIKWKTARWLRKVGRPTARLEPLFWSASEPRVQRYGRGLSVRLKLKTAARTQLGFSKGVYHTLILNWYHG